MKKLPAFLNTPARLVVAVVLLILLAELLIMLVILNLHNTILVDEVMEEIVFGIIDPILLTVIVAPALFFLIFRPMRAQQAGLERQLDELLRFQKLTVGRELRMKELAEENAALRKQIAAAQPGGTKS